MIGSAESPFIWDSSPPTMAHLGSHPIWLGVVDQ